jgi:L-asparaginase II
MLALARHFGLPLVDYVDPGHPIQQAIRRAVAEMCGLGPEAVTVGVDGCSAPNFAVALASAAAAFARLAGPDELPPDRAAALRRLFDAMTRHPEMVRGPRGFDTELMRLRPGLIVSKGGAEGYQAMGLAPGALGHGSPALGVALKVADGTGRAVGLAAAEVLRQLGALTAEPLTALAALGHAPPQTLKNWRGQAVGQARAVFQLSRFD